MLKIDDLLTPSDMAIQALRGMNDILPDEIPLWLEVEKAARGLFACYGYEEIRTPIVEEMALFTRTLGETTNVVEKEMYAFQDRNEKWVCLRPEGTASVVRAYIEHHLGNEDPVGRYFYFGPMYRYERPQKGRLRQFYQAGVEVFGISSPRLDAEVIEMTDRFFKELGLKDLTLEINSLGCPFCRPKYLGAFLNFLKKNEESLCSDCKRRIERNPLRALDCKDEGCIKITGEGPSIHDFICEDCEENFDAVLKALGKLDCPYKINPRIVRGLDYYLRTTFEFVSTELGAQNAVAGGGRYDGLVRLLGGPNVPGFGFAIGLERLIELLVLSKKKVKTENNGVFLALLGEKAISEGIQIAKTLREKGFAVLHEFEEKSMKSQMRRADRLKVKTVVIIGDNELKSGKFVVKEMSSGRQREISREKLADAVK